MDFIVQLPVTKHYKDAILVFIDRLSKMVHFAATHTTVTAKDTARLFRHEVFRLHGMPREIILDRDTRFTSNSWKEVCRLLDIRQGLSTAYHPQTDGQTERTNRILEDMLRHYVNPMLDDWDEHLDAVEFAVNNAWQESIKTTPFYSNYGLRPHTPIRAELPSKVPAAAKFSHEWQLTVLEALRFLVGAEQRDAAVQRKMEADVSLAQARANLSNAQARQKVQADKHRSEEPSFAKGSGVLLSTKNIQWKHPGARKLLPLWIGPFKILQKIGKVAYKLQPPEGMKMHNVSHVNLLKKLSLAQERWYHHLQQS
jgi:transposase InsO family protein